MFRFCLLATLWLMSSSQLPAQPLRVRIERSGNGFSLRVNDRPYYVRGFVGASQFALAQAYGANSVRTDATAMRAGSPQNQLDEAQKHTLTALVNLPLPGERDGMDWNDETRKDSLRRRTLATVETLKNHPAVLVWALGNELDWIPPGKPYNRKLWTFLNDLARAIHQIDPNHPVMTVVGTSEMPQKFDELARLCPDLDLLGLNAYADLAEICTAARQHWKRPYMVTEWGPDGHWEVPKTTWKVPLEQTSTQKAQSYRERYRHAIRADSTHCLGSYVFYWHHKQEITHTWYGMFDERGNATETAEAMRECWLGGPPANRAPRLTRLHMVGQPDPRNVRLRPAQNLRVNVAWQEPDNDPLRLSWEIREEAQYASYAGQGERAARTVAQATLPTPAEQFSVTAPTAPGKYRLFVYLYDGQRHVAVANQPFLVE